MLCSSDTQNDFFVCVSRHITICHTLADLVNVPEPKVIPTPPPPPTRTHTHTLIVDFPRARAHTHVQAVLVSVPDLECGFSRDLFVEWTKNPKNSVILTCRTSPGSLSRFLIDNPKTTSVEMTVSLSVLKKKVINDLRACL